MKFLTAHNDDIKNDTLKNALENLKLTSPNIQKDIIWAGTATIIDVIIKHIGDALFAILVDESRDIAIKEQMAIVLRYVDKNGHVIEWFIGVEHVSSTTALSLKVAIDKLFSRHGLSISRLQGQGYDGASNMQGEFNGFKNTYLEAKSMCFLYSLFFSLTSISTCSGGKKANTNCITFQHSC